jgi:transcription elongation factor GreA-like protein
LELATLEELEEQGDITLEQACRKVQIQKELLHLLKKEEAFWQQRSKEQCMVAARGQQY